MARRNVLPLLVATTLLHSTCPAPNPCRGVSNNAFAIVPGSGCKDYVQCADEKITDEQSCAGDTIYDVTSQYCNWVTSVTCVDTVDPTPSPVVGGNEEEEAATESPSDCPNPCFGVASGFQTIPGTNCKEYVQCLQGEPSSGTLTCGDGTIFNPMGGYCDWETSVSCEPVECPPTTSLNGTSTTTTNDDDNTTTVDEPTAIPCTMMPCPPDKNGLYVVPNTQCSKYVQCQDGNVTETFDCPDGTMFSSKDGICNRVDLDAEGSSPKDFCPDDCTMEHVNPPSIQPTSKSDDEPHSIHENFHNYLYQRREIMNAIVFQSQYGPSIEYVHQDMMNALNVVVYQLPIPLTFYVGDYYEIKGINYGLVNLAAFLANAMAEGIKTDSCDEWNTDDIDSKNWKFPLSNACGQYGRMYQAEVCRDDTNSMCPIVKSMNLTAASSPLTHGPSLKGPPPFSCHPTGKSGSFVGYYDSLTDTIVDSAFANSLGRTNVESCCWWGRGALLTRGRCIMGKLNKYLGKQAADEGFNSPYKYIDFCNDPNAICQSYISRELRWTIAFLEWSDFVQNYIHVDDWTRKKWTYWDQLKSFVDEGMVDDRFLDQVINILIRNCHDGLCSDVEIPFLEERRNNFRRIIGEVFNLPLRGNEIPGMKMTEPTFAPTPRPTRNKLLALTSNSARVSICICPLLLTTVLTISHFIWW